MIASFIEALGVGAVISAVTTLPIAVGMVTPLRYELNEMFKPTMPGGTDIVLFAVRECFVPSRLTTLLESYPGESYTKAMARAGFNETWAQMYWGAHWQLPSISQLNEYLYRHPEFVDTWRSYARYLDLIPEAIPWLEEIIHPPYTRVDLRRMWDLRTVDEETLIREYSWQGYDKDHAAGMVLWTKVYTELPYLVAKFEHGVLNEAQLTEELVKLGMPEERVRDLMYKILPAPKAAKVKSEKDLTKSEIVKGVKAGILGWRDGVELLQDLGYDEDEAAYILAISVTVAKGHPGGFWEMKRATELYRKSQGMTYVDIPQELVDLEAERTELVAKLEEQRKEKPDSEEVAKLATELAPLEARYARLVREVKNLEKEVRAG